MAIDQESFNTDLYKLLRTRGYKPVPKDAKNQRTQPEAAEVFNFTFTKNGKDYGDAWVTIDDASNVVLYYSNEQEESPSGKSPNLDYDDSWSGLKRHLKQWSMNKQLSFELRNKDTLGDDMAQRDYVKKKETIGEGYHSMGKKASYNDNIPAVKIILQHNRQIEEGEQRYRNIAKIFLENQDGERFLAPTTRPGIAQVYARHIAEGGVPNDERWNHIKSICEEYSKMAGFVRATKNKQFNESAQSLVNEGINHYQSLRETLGKLRGHRGYNMYFESWTPALLENDGDSEVNLNELFVQETLDPRIESVMPILSRLQKSKGSSIKEVSELAEWADQVTPTTPAIAVGEGIVDTIGRKYLSKIIKTEMHKNVNEDQVSSRRPTDEEYSRAKKALDAMNPMSRLAGIGVDAHTGDVHIETAIGEEFILRAGSDELEMVGILEGLDGLAGDWGWKPKDDPKPTQKVFGATLDAEEIRALKDAKRAGKFNHYMKVNGDQVTFVTDDYKKLANDLEHIIDAGETSWGEILNVYEATTRHTNNCAYNYGHDCDCGLKEGLDKNQKRAGQLGPTEKVGKEGAVGKLVGANESVGDKESEAGKRWKLSLMDYDEAVKKYGKDNVREGPKNKLGDPTIEILSKLDEGQEDLDFIKKLIK
jgi:hypothetical protein